MGKSLGNFTTLGDALDAHGPRAFRLAVLQVHYRSQMELTANELGAAAEGIQRVDNLARRTEREGDPSADSDPEVVGAFEAAMDLDFGTAAAVAAIFDAVKQANSAFDGGDMARGSAIAAAVPALLAVLGFPDAEAVAEDERAEIDALVQARNDARAAKDFAQADSIRDELSARGITIQDSATGTLWHR